ncbi:MAG: cell division protein ZapA [Balneola sp.]|jgi:cell division protein ZapA|uniref:cell division protein ZapA n=1 Tax=Balneola sp. EhC07 TaxID=1849360 RepID=UPI0007F39039|nr:cell division protein ZapA [Balneola sp. EhC07]MAB67744.1 cell division protein ZapA [Bacteroidota bacterium]MAC04075.1 cell division protein ZapA [Balneola sp.]MBR9917173.1 cell division protein ZapA [bacterium]MAO78082.1 cell division protein ZapA [Balneola sp.]MBF64083.1 cell division protein ZapA [Balneola sp.]|tara:strand:+ start:1508 stop:1804 length:297 start_codon:yes stop_codon:yes gene_type:complete
MKSIKVTILGKQYPLKVEDSEEENMIRICNYVDERFKTYREQLVKQPESTVMSLAALSIAEELFEARNNSSELEKNEHHTMERVNKSLEKLLLQIKEE